MFATILGFAPMALNLALSAASRWLTPKNAQYAGHAANLTIQALSLAEKLNTAHAEGRDITDDEIAAATQAATRAADDFNRVLSELKAGQ